MATAMSAVLVSATIPDNGFSVTAVITGTVLGSPSIRKWRERRYSATVQAVQFQPRADIHLKGLRQWIETRVSDQRVTGRSCAIGYQGCLEKREDRANAGHILGDVGRENITTLTDRLVEEHLRLEPSENVPS